MRAAFFAMGALSILLFSSLSATGWAQVAQPETKKEGEAEGEFVPGAGFDIIKSKLGSLTIGGYMLVRYLNQLPEDQTFTDHLGRVQTINTRNDIQVHRILLHFRGFLFSKKFTYQTSIWSLPSTNSTVGFGALNYAFSKGFNLGAGVGALPGTRSMNYEHPYFLGTDRQMADEFFRPGFTAGIWASGVLPNVYYRVMIGNCLNLVNVTAAQLTSDYAYSGTIAWMPTTGEFGPKGGFGDFEMHDRLATRFGISATQSREDRFTDLSTAYPDNTSIRLSDSLPLFQTGSLAPGVTIQKANYTLLSADASVKYRGFFLLGEYYHRIVGDFAADGVLPLDAVLDDGFMVQTSYMAIPRKLEAYASHSQIYGQFNRAWSLGGGLNYYPAKSRSLRMNAMVIYVDRASSGSLFGYFVGGQKGPIISVSTDIFF